MNFRKVHADFDKSVLLFQIAIILVVSTYLLARQINCTEELSVLFSTVYFQYFDHVRLITSLDIFQAICLWNFDIEPYYMTFLLWNVLRATNC